MKKLLILMVSLLLTLSFFNCSKDDDSDKTQVEKISVENSQEIMEIYMGSINRSMMTVTRMMGGMTLPTGRAMSATERQAYSYLAKAPQTLVDTTITIVNDSEYVQIHIAVAQKLNIDMVYKTATDTMDSEFELTLYDSFNQVIILDDTSGLDNTPVAKAVVVYDFYSSILDPELGRIKDEGDGNYTIQFERSILDSSTISLNGSGHEKTNYQNKTYELSITIANLVMPLSIASESEEPSGYPTSGTVKMQDGDGNYILLTFNGTAIVTMTVKDGGQTYTFTFNLETGETDPV